MAEQKRTQFAMQAFGFAEVFNIKVGDQKVAGHRVELSAPEGPSTGGGKQSVQHVKLVAEDDGAVIVAGSCDQIEKSAEIRTYEYLADLHAQRFRGAALPVDKAAYQALVGRMQAFFAEMGLRVVMLDAPRPVAGGVRAPAPSASGVSATMIVVMIAIAALVGVGVVFFLRAK